MTYTPRHLAAQPTRPSQTSRQGLVVFATVALVLLGATPAHAADIVIPRGATLWGIAAKYCGGGAKYMDLARANGIANPNRIYAGAKLNVTCARPATTTASRSTPARTTAAPTGWVHPLPSGARSSCYGQRTYINAQGRRVTGFHAGTDLAAPNGTPIRAAHSGTVARIAYEADGAGHYVVLSHGNGVYTAYFHMIRRTPLALGQTVQAGQAVGNIGTSGDSTGPHLHFEVHQGGMFKKVNPAAFMRAQGIGVGC